jgi:hypothetical protein
LKNNEIKDTDEETDGVEKIKGLLNLKFGETGNISLKM